MNSIRHLARLAVALAFFVILLGAWTRLKDAGLGCPDWPTCYGHISVPDEAHEIVKADAMYPGQMVIAEKAWPEMIHRYFASALGLIIMVIAFLSWRNRHHGLDIKLPFALFVLVCVQGAFGAWTVTMKLMPIVVTLHLLLGFTTFCLLCVLSMQWRKKNAALQVSLVTRRYALVALIVVGVQIALGGWTSSNYAAVSCLELPVCQGNWMSEANFGDAFDLHLTDRNYEFGIHDHATRMAIHVTHRLGAIVAIATVFALIILLWKSASPAARTWAKILGSLLLLQIALGVNNIVSQLPLVNAVAHNGVGAVLVMSLVLINVLITKNKANT